MSFEAKVEELSKLSVEQRGHLKTEEAVKTAIILRMFHALEFDPFNPLEIIPEFTADHGIKKGEKVDYAIKLNGQVAILVECKSPDQKLDLKHASQLYRYFSVTNARFAVLTNGFDWQFYTDLDEPNKMDGKPFLSFKLNDLEANSVSELSKFRKSVFDVDKILSTASDLKYISALKSQIRNEFEQPSDELVSLIGRRVYEGRFTAQVHEQFSSLIKRSITEVIRDRVNARLSSAIQHSFDDTESDEPTRESEIETTEDEWDGFRIVTAIVAQDVDPARVHIRDTKTYCGVLLDNNNRKPLARLWFNSKTTRYLGLFDGENEERVQISNVSDIYKYSDRIRAAAAKYFS